MISDPDGTVLALLAAFCRIGGCFMFLPGFASARIPTQLRLFVSLGITMALMPILWSDIYPKIQVSDTAYIKIIFVETVTGSVIGLVARYFVLGLQFAGTVVNMMCGFNAPPAADVLENDSASQLTNMISFAGLLILFLLDFHHTVIEALVDSYGILPFGGVFDAQKALVTLTDTISQTFMVMLRLSSPFILYGFLFNVAIGFVNKLAPQVPIFFISAPFTVMGGLFLVYFGITQFIHLFGEAFLPIFGG